MAIEDPQWIRMLYWEHHLWGSSMDQICNITEQILMSSPTSWLSRLVHPSYVSGWTLLISLTKPDISGLTLTLQTSHAHKTRVFTNPQPGFIRIRFRGHQRVHHLRAEHLQVHVNTSNRVEFQGFHSDAWIPWMWKTVAPGRPDSWENPKEIAMIHYSSLYHEV